MTHVCLLSAVLIMTFQPRSLSAGQLNWFDPSTGKKIVYNGGDIAWTLDSTALVWIMIPGIGFFYSGLLRRKNGLSMIYLSVGTIAIVSFQVSANATVAMSLMLIHAATVVLLGILSYIQRHCKFIHRRSTLV